MPPHSSHILQPLDVALYSPLKRAYGDQINLFIRSFINHITKSDFFVAFKAAHDKVFTEKNIKSAFRGAGISPWDPDSVIYKLDIRLRNPSCSPPRSPCEWEPRTPRNAQETIQQCNYVKNRISCHQGSSPTPILEDVDRLGKSSQEFANRLALVEERLRVLENANLALSKRRRAKKSRLQLGGALSIEDSQAMVEERQKRKRKAEASQTNGDGEELIGPVSNVRCCGKCGRAGHNVRTCEDDK
ncbi:hypothetical protein K3495_g16366 [Podosphaera aphanis]|nr:hypothetical protein K3495_g16366 [Podosphaera aphanis]